MQEYIINSSTNALLLGDNTTKIYHENGVLLSTININKIMDVSCKYYGSSLLGRVAGAKYMLGSSYKTPIIVSEKNMLIFFPTMSMRKKECVWLNSSNILNYEKHSAKETIITFKNKNKLVVFCSFRVIDKQILKSSRLENIILRRK